VAPVMRYLEGMSYGLNRGNLSAGAKRKHANH
jgi:hypothetical protein